MEGVHSHHPHRSLSLGPGSLAAASLGCRVLATDYRQLPLDLLRRAAEACGVPVPERQVLAPGTHHLPDVLWGMFICDMLVSNQ